MVSDMAVVSDVSQAAGAPGQLSDGSAAPLCDASHLSVSARLGRLQFHRSGKFRILQFADIQDGPHVNKDTVRLIAAACDSARPDIVIFSGNQIAGYDPAYAGTFINRPWAANWKEY
ncbi:MAG: serine/threonine protein phosphatase, partial [Scardovia wiggsiae]